MSKRGLFITFEGTDGVGKSTQMQLLRGWLEGRRYHVLVTREPGGGPVAERLRALVLDPTIRIENLTELFLYEAARVEHVSKIINPALQAGRIVLCDRFTDSTLAYQGVGRNLMKTAEALNQIATGGTAPDLTILLTLKPEIGLARARRRHGKNGGDRLENEGLEFQRKVQRGFVQLAKRNPRRIKIVPVQELISKTHEKIRTIVEKKLNGNFRPAKRASLH